MFNALAKHGGWSLTLSCNGDLWIDDHHSADKYIPSISILLVTYPEHRTAPWL